jgi:hypothetical protein
MMSENKALRRIFERKTTNRKLNKLRNEEPYYVAFEVSHCCEGIDVGLLSVCLSLKTEIVSMFLRNVAVYVLVHSPDDLALRGFSVCALH